MNPEVDLKDCDMLEAEERPYTDKDGKAKTARALLFKYGGKIFKMSADKELQMSKAVAKVGKKATITLSMSTFGASIDPDFRITDVV